MKMEQLATWLKLTLLAAILATAAWHFHFDWKALYLYWKSAGYAHTRGRIQRVEIEKSIFSSKGSRSSYRIVHIDYSYSVNGTGYSGNVLGTFSPMLHRSEALDHARKYRPGQEVTVLYDPDDPSQSLLERRLTTGTVTSVVVSLLIVIVLGVVFLFLYRIGIFAADTKKGQRF